MLGIVLFLVFLSIFLLAVFGWPLLVNGVSGQVSNPKRMSKRIDRILLEADAQRVSQMYMYAPIALALVLFFVLPDPLRLYGVIAGVILGLFIPGFYASILVEQTRRKFNDQLPDALMIMSSSFRGGLSLVQAMESVVEEMPDPAKREFRIVIGENKMGVTLDDCLNHMYRRMPSLSLQQMNTAILLARETGGNLPAVFTQIVNSIRERKKLQQHIDALTMQGKIQGVVMSGLPILFAIFVSSTQPNFFDVMFNTETGRMLLIIAVFLWVVGVFFIWKISSYKEF